jgi:hypothetical protein
LLGDLVEARGDRVCLQRLDGASQAASEAEEGSSDKGERGSGVEGGPTEEEEEKPMDVPEFEEIEVLPVSGEEEGDEFDGADGDGEGDANGAAVDGQRESDGDFNQGDFVHCAVPAPGNPSSFVGICKDQIRVEIVESANCAVAFFVHRNNSTKEDGDVVVKHWGHHNTNAAYQTTNEGCNTAKWKVNDHRKWNQKQYQCAKVSSKQNRREYTSINQIDIVRKAEDRYQCDTATNV